MKDEDITILKKVYEKIKEVVDSKENEIRAPDYIVMNLDDRDHVRYFNECFFHGYFFEPEDRWAYFNAFDCQFPKKD